MAAHIYDVYLEGSFHPQVVFGDGRVRAHLPCDRVGVAVLAFWLAGYSYIVRSTYKCHRFDWLIDFNTLACFFGNKCHVALDRMVGWLVVFYVPSTARSFRDGTPIYCPLRRTWSSVFTPFSPELTRIQYPTLTIDPRRSLSTCLHRQVHKLPNLLHSRAALSNSYPKALRAKQWGSLSHFYDSIWYDLAGTRTHHLLYERRTC